MHDPHYAPRGAGHGYGFAGLEEDRDVFDPLKLLFCLLRYRWLIAIFLSVGMVTGLMATWVMTPKYESTAQMEIMVPSARVFQELEVVAAPADERAFLTAREKLMSRSLAQRVVFELGLAEKGDFLFPAANFAPSNLLDRAFGAGLSVSLDDLTPEEREQLAVDRVRGGLSVELIRKTSLLAVTFSHQDPEYAHKVAGQTARSFIDHGVDRTSETSELARQFIEEQVGKVKAKLQASEEALVAYARREGLTVTGDDTSLIAGNIEEINKALSAAIRERLDYGRLVGQIEQGRGASLPQVLESKAIESLREKVAALSAEYQEKLSAFKPAFPQMRRLSAQIAEMKRQVDGATKVITQSVRLRYEEAVAREADLRSKLKELEAEQAAFQDKNIRYTILKREVASNRSQYESLIGKLNKVGVGAALETSNAVIVDPAALPRKPHWPRPGLNLAAALGLFMGIAGMIIYARELLDNTFSTPDLIESDLGLPVLGILPEIDGTEFDRQFWDRTSVLSEAIRSLRTALQFVGPQGEPRTLLVTSTEPGEGKSMTACKLAMEFAALGLRVLLIDADMRKPVLHRLFGTDNTMGLSNLLAGVARDEDEPKLFRLTKVPNLVIMTSGPVPPNPPDLLASARMARAVQICMEHYDMVIFDGPPVLSLSDAPILSHVAEGTLMVVSANQVRRKSVAVALGRIRAADGIVPGAVLNRFSADRLGYGHAYGYMAYAYGGPERQLADGTSDGGTLDGGTGMNMENGNQDTFVEKVRGHLRGVGELLRRRLDGVG